MKSKKSKKKKKNDSRRLFRVIFRGHEYLGTAEQYHAKVVAPDFATAMKLACDAMSLDPKVIDGAAVTLISEDTELADGKVFDFAKRSRAFGDRGGWVCWNVLPRKEPTGPRRTSLL
jgi:hypothetical protein